MLLKVLCVASWALVAAGSIAAAQTLAQIGGPKELPPPSFDGQQFIDSRGCVFLRAGFDGQTNWVPRVTQDRKVLCGYPPTFGLHERVPAVPDVEVASAPPPTPVAPPVAKPAPVAAAAAPAPRPRTATEAAVTASAAPGATRGCPATAPYAQPLVGVDGKQMMVCSANRSVGAQPVVAPAVVAPIASAPVVAASTGQLRAGQVACPASVPVLMRVSLRDGGTALLCTRGDGTLDGARAPRYPSDAPLAPSLYGPQYALRAAPQIAAPAPVRTAAVQPVPVMPPVPKGYKRAWTDDRLNVYRAIGTAQGQAAQDRIWTRTVPAQLVTTTKPAVAPPVTYAARQQPAVTASAMSSATAPVEKPQARAVASTGRAFVQVGTFAQPSNADGAAGRLAALGLPVSRGKITSGGKPMQIIFAGPFASPADAQTALSAARRGGFPDAFIR